MKRSATMAATLLAVVLMMTGCSFLAGKAVPQSEVEDDVSKELNDATGQDQSASCDGDLDAEKDATVDCTWDTSEGETIDVTVTATSVDGDDVEYKIEFDQDQLPGSEDSGASDDSDSSGDSGSSDDSGSESAQSGNPVEQAELENFIRDGMKRETGKSYPVSCEGGLDGEVGAQQRCVWEASDGSTLGITVKVNEFDENGEPNIGFQADSSPTPAPQN